MRAELSKLDRQIPAAPGGVDIIGFPQLLHTCAYGSLDLLFLPLLEAAREALGVVEHFNSRGETREQILTMSRIHLASTLLKDSSFALSARRLTSENHYTVDLDGGTILVHTRLYAVVSRRTAMFQVEIAGKIKQGPYVVRGVSDDSTVIQIDEQQLRQPNFFSTTLAEECLRLRMDREQFRRYKNEGNAEDNSDVFLTVATRNVKIPVVLKKNETGSDWDVLDGRMRARLGTLSPEAENHLRRLLAGLATMLESRQGPGEPASSTNSPVKTNR